MDTRPSRRERREAERQARKAQYQAEKAEQKNVSSAPPKVSSRPHVQTGPRTPAGKSVSSMNAFRHGLTSARLVLPWENEDEFDELLNQLIDEHQPATATESILTREMAEQYWRLQRVRNQECDALAISTGSDDELKRLTLLDRYATRHERSFHKCLNTLRQLQKERRAKAEGDFVSQKPEAPAEPAPKTFDSDARLAEMRTQYFESLPEDARAAWHAVSQKVQTTESAA